MIDRNPHQQHMEHITWDEQHIAMIIWHDYLPDETTLLTLKHRFLPKTRI